MNLDAQMDNARSTASLRWATQLARELEAMRPGLAGPWAREAFRHFLHHPALAEEKVARRLYEDLVESGRKLDSVDQVRAVWPDHEGRPLELAVLRLWTGLGLDGHVDELGAALELLFDDTRLSPGAREAPLLLFRHYATAHLQL